MRSVCLLRHAKSDWGDPALADFDRPLAPRGLAAAPRMAEFMVAAGLVPELILCSGARRAVETFQRLAPFLGEVPALIENDLYMASSDALIQRLRAVPAEFGSVLLIGHNPGIEETAVRLAGSSKGSSLKRLRRKYPTCGLAVISFEQGADLLDGEGCLEAFVGPKDL